MKAPMRTSICFIACIASLLVVGCTKDSTTQARSSGDELGTSIEQVRTEIAGAKVQIEATMSSLDNLLATEERATLPRRYDIYVQNVESLKEQREQLSQRSDDMLDRREQYISDWRASLEGVENAALRQTAHERIDTMSAQFTSIRQQLVEAQFAMQPMIQTLEGVQATLAYDLSPQGLERVAAALEQQPLNQEEAQEQLTSAQQELDQLDQMTVLTTTRIREPRQDGQQAMELEQDRDFDQARQERDDDIEQGMAAQPEWDDREQARTAQQDRDDLEQARAAQQERDDLEQARAMEQARAE